MGYTTDFSGGFQLSRKLTDTERNYINNFSGTRRMKRDVKKLMELYNGKYGYPIELYSPEYGYPFSTEELDPLLIYGRGGEYFAHGDGNCGQEKDDSVINYNSPPGQSDFNGLDNFISVWGENRKKINDGLCQPGLWCQWVISDDVDFDYLVWDGGEKFYNYIEWLKYMIEHFFEKWGVKLNGEVEWNGEDSDDIGKIVVKDNIVKIYEGRISFYEVE